jgi:hypothetical protein
MTTVINDMDRAHSARCLRRVAKLALLRSCGPGLPIGVWNRDKEGTRAGQAVGTNTLRHAISVTVRRRDTDDEL